jgi:hypothetical protein
MEPSIGRIVRVITRGSEGKIVVRPAMITKVFPSLINATVFYDKEDGVGVVGIITNLRFDEKGVAVNTWHWPSRD